MAGRNFMSLVETSAQSLALAVRNTIQTYTQKIERFGGPRLDESQKLENFLTMKKITNTNSDMDSRNASNSNSGSSLLDSQHRDHEIVEYDWISIVDQEGRDIDYACYLLLPGGSCYGPCHLSSGSSSHCSTFSERAARKQMSENAAEVALMNLIFNESPSRKISPDFIKTALDHAASHYMTPLGPSRTMSQTDQLGLEGFGYVLEYMTDKSMMEYQELSNILALLSWSGCMLSMLKRGSCRQDVLDYCAGVTIDEAFRSELAMYVVDMEEGNPGFITDELRQSEDELIYWRRTGRELRFPCKF